MVRVLELAAILLGSSVALFLVTRVLDRLLARESGVLAVARVLLREGYRRRIVPGTFATLVLGIGVLALWGGETALPHYRVRTFITFSLQVSGFFLAGMTLLLACATMADEIARRRVFTTLVKPVRRSTFLIGKWLGLLVVNGSLLLVLGGLVAVLATLTARAAEPEDRARIEGEVLVARGEVFPYPAQPLRDEARAELDRLHALEVPHDHAEDDAHLEQIYKEKLAEWLTVELNETEVYVFRDIPRDENARLVLRPNMTVMGGRRVATDQPVQLRLRIGDDTHELTVARDQELSFPLTGAELSHGELRVAVTNLGTGTGSRLSQPTLRLNRQHALEVLHDAGSFAGNLLRALLVVWIKLAFCAALGLCAATFLGFPVATLASLIVVTMAVTSGFIAEEVVFHTHGPGDGHSHSHGPSRATERDDHRVVDAVLETLQDLGQGVAGWLVEFSRYAAVPRLADGRVVPWHEVGAAAWLLGLVWAGGTLVLGMGILARRELARVQV